MQSLLLLLLLLPLVVRVNGDIYLHNPSGSNNRNRERNENRNNGNRLFDSQNNDKGGYPWRGNRELKNEPDPMVYYEGSKLRIEWTNQHACGNNPTTHCAMILQYACEDSMPKMRDGYPSGGLADADSANPSKYMHATFQRNTGNQNYEGTTTIPTTEEAAADYEYGMHESFDYYSKCASTERNHGLYIADQKVGCAAINTRQNPNGQRHGYECVEERDYYPWWSPTVWRDIAVMPSNTQWCDYYRENSQNVKDRFFCQDANVQKTKYKKIPIQEQACLSAGGKWVKTSAWNIGAPDCIEHFASRQNHLGNVFSGKDPITGPETAHYVWTIPKVAAESTCVLRIRYNISTADYDSYAGFSAGDDKGPFDSSYNCDKKTMTAPVDASSSASAEDATSCTKILENGNMRPRFNRPYVDVFGEGPKSTVSIALNTNQAGRTFQDRSHVFKIARRPKSIPKHATVWNLNVRGRRGNIVQSYPAVEYDFVPQELEAKTNSYIHFQWSGSDFNAARNPNNAEGWQYSDRHNMVEIEDLNTQFPVSTQNMHFFDPKTAMQYATQGQDDILRAKGSACATFTNGAANEQNDPTNCGKLNSAPAHFNPAPHKLSATGTFYFTNTRNNNFSNRSQKLIITVSASAMDAAAIAGIVVGVTFGLVLTLVGGYFAYCWYNGRIEAFYDCMRVFWNYMTCKCFCAENVDGSAKKTKKQKRKDLADPLLREQI